MQSPAGQPGLQNQEALTGFTEQRLRSHPHSVVVHQGMPRFVRFRSDQMMGRFHIQARGTGRDQERRCAVMNGHVGIGDRDDDEEGGNGSVGGEVLSSGDDPVSVF